MSETKPSTIGQITEALDSIADSVRSDNLPLYLDSIKKARGLGCTEDQIQDAYQYPCRGGKFPSFNRNGEVR